LAFVDKLYKTLRNEAYAKSVELAQERGAFPVFDWETEKDCAFIKRLPKSIRDGIAEHGRRNIALLTQAPTGSVSLLSKVGEFDTFNVSSGVEPVFRNSYTRRKKINPGDDNARIDYVDVVGDSWQEFKVYHSNVQNFLDKAKETFIGHGFNGDCMPEYFVTSDQIDWEKRVEIQGAEQKYIDHSISSTINLPRGTDPEVVGKLYLESWKRGLKGVTVYVDGSRDGVLVTEEDKEIDEDGRPLRITHTEAPKRPKELMAEIHNATVKGVRWTVIVGLLHGEPYELFMGKAEKFDLGKLSEGKILRAKKGNYNLLSMDNTVVLTDILDVAGSDEGAWITRMMSMALRHGVPIEYIADQLSKDGSVVDLNNVLARLLKRYVKKRDEKEDESCPQCASHAIVYEEGCKKCSDCGWAGCG
jgi:ribonucleoside-diphosphate reductase alpha chain